MPAAMMVAMLVGAIRTQAARSPEPSAMLEVLNERLYGRSSGGFSTCVAAHIDASGWITVADAGHLSPYRNGVEMDLPGALPLGITTDGSYPAQAMQLEPGDRLTFLSDGVVEARNEEKELFGFERTRAMSRQPALAIAQAAQRFGQEDDITVLTVEFAGTAEASRQPEQLLA